MRNRLADQTLRRLLTAARYEVLPTAAAEEAVHAVLPVGFTVTVTASPAKGLEATLALTERLASAGYAAVPHLAARMISGRSELADIAARMSAAGVRTIFVPAGDQEPPAGEYDGSLGVLEDLHELGDPFPNVGVTGYPESHPAIHDDVTVQAMWDKRRFATHIVSNLTFDADVLVTWVRRMRNRGVRLPLLVGVPGPVDRAKLLATATKIGIGESTRFLVKHRRTLTRLAAPGGFTGEQFLQRAARGLGDPGTDVVGLHVFTFNQVAETERWRRDLLARLVGPVPAVK